MGYLKIVVKIPDTIYPELVADLERVQLRDRAERVRVLAMLGLRNDRFPVKNQSLSPSTDASPPSESASVGATNKLIQKLSESL
jgi:hypothetical protein